MNAWTKVLSEDSHWEYGNKLLAEKGEGRGREGRGGIRDIWIKEEVMEE